MSFYRYLQLNKRKILNNKIANFVTENNFQIYPRPRELNEYSLYGEWNRVSWPFIAEKWFSQDSKPLKTGIFTKQSQKN